MPQPVETNPRERAAMDRLARRDAEASLPNSDFRVPPSPPRKTLCMPFGRTGEGKSFFALLNAPSPIAYFDIDGRGLYAVEVARAAGKIIHYCDIPYPSGIARSEDARAKAIAQASLDKFLRNLDVAIRESERGNVRSIVPDTITELYELNKIAVEGRVDRKPTDYGRARGITNAGFKEILKRARLDSKAHLIAIARSKKIFDEPSLVDPEVPDFLPFEMDWTAWIRSRKLTPKQLKDTPVADRFELQIFKPGQNEEERGKVYTADDWGPLGPFAYACMQLHVGTSARDWK